MKSKRHIRFSVACWREGTVWVGAVARTQHCVRTCYEHLCAFMSFYEPHAPKWNLCNAPGSDNGGKVKSLGAFLASDDKVLVCTTHATFRFAVDQFGIAAFDDRLIAVDEFHHVSANPDNKLGAHLGEFITRDKVHIVAMTGSYFRGDAEAVLRVFIILCQPVSFHKLMWLSSLSGKWIVS